MTRARVPLIALAWLAAAVVVALGVRQATENYRNWQLRPDALAAAVKAGQDEEVGRLLRQLGKKTGEAIAHKDAAGDTPLMWAVRTGSRTTCRALLERGADPNTISKNGSSPLQEAAISGRKEIAILLLQYGATRGREGALVWAAIHGESDLLTLLLQKRANPNAQGERGTTALMHAASRGSAADVRALLAAGASAAPRDRDGRTALSYAADRGSVPVITSLIKAGAVVNLRDRFGRTPLGRARERGHQAAARALVAAGAKG